MSTSSIAYLCPLRPSSPNQEGIPSAEGWDSIEDADVLVEPGERLTDMDDRDDVVDADDGTEVQLPIGVPAPSQPSKAEVARHNLTRQVQKLVSALRLWTAEQHCTLFPNFEQKACASFLRRLLLCP